jgi:Dolichyl-phosphate-mannose-protein mannosyltransferase
LARNILDRSAGGLLNGLSYAQVAPAGFLLIEKADVRLFGTSEYALRAFPLACGILSQILLWQIAKRVLSGWFVPFAVGLLSLGVPFIYFSSQVKQYSSDVAAALLLLLAAVEIRRRGATRTRACWFGIVGAIIVWFSQPAAFVLAGVGLALVIMVWRERDIVAARTYAICGTVWAVSASAAALLAMRNLTEMDRDYFRAFWSEGFMPFPPRTVADLGWLPNKLVWAFGRFASGMARTSGGLNYRWSAVFTITMLVGLWGLWKSEKNRDVALFVGLPVVLVAALSAAKLYPFTARLFTFLLPGLLLATAAGTEQVLANWPSRAQFLTPAFLAVIGGSPVYALATALPPFWLQHLRPVVEYMIARREPEDAVYVFFGAGQAFRYYAQRYGLTMDNTVVGSCSIERPRQYLHQIDQLRGKPRVWILLTHDRGEGKAVIVDYLDHVGRRLEAVEVPGSSGRPVEGASGYLYDLSDSKRFTAVSASTFSIAGETIGPSSRWDCYGVGLSESP